MEKKYKNNKVTQLNNSLVEENNDIETPCESSNSLYATNNSSALLSESMATQIKIPNIDNQLNKFNSINKKENKEQNKEQNKEPTNDLKFDSIILNLKIISKLKPGFKLSVRDSDSLENSDVYIDTSYFQYFYRMWSDNSREQTTMFLENLDLEINKNIEELINQEDTNMFLNSKENILLNLSHNLNLSLVGLNNLINTYSNDEYTISKIEMIINNFELKIRKISSIIKIH